MELYKKIIIYCAIMYLIALFLAREDKKAEIKDYLVLIFAPISLPLMFIWAIFSDI